ncbi:MAG: RNA polymerase sigma factor [Acidobacteriota bacterium]
MASAVLVQQAQREDWSDEEVVRRVLDGETALYELLMRRHNQRLYRVARAILRDDAEAEDVMQDAYVRAYQNLASFEGRAKFVTWLTRIAVHEALTRSRRRLRFRALDPSDESNGEIMQSPPSSTRSPEQQAYDRELAAVLEKAVSSLSEDQRLVFMLRDVEGMTTEETAHCLNLTEENVKVRLHRARAGLRKRLYRVVGATAARCFQFHAVRCDRVVKNVFGTLGIRAPHLG